MYFFNWSDILNSVIYSFVFGASFSLSCSMLRNLFSLFSDPQQVLNDIRSFVSDPRQLKRLFKNDSICNQKYIKNNFIDFFKTLSFGILFSILLYACQDGVFRIYMLVISLSVCFLFDKTVSRCIDAFLYRVLKFFKKTIICAVSIIFIPIAAVFRFICTHFIARFFVKIKKLFAKIKDKSIKNEKKEPSIE